MVPTKTHSDDYSHSRIVFIGEAPGNVEISKGEPFVGPSGHLLSTALEEYGIVRDEVTLTNACLCHYPQSMKKLPPAAIEACRDRLLSEIEVSGAPIVMPMGNSAIAGVMPKEQAKAGITQLRAGAPKTSVWLPDGVVVIPTFHPAACLRAQEKWPRMLADIGKGARPENLPKFWYEPTIVVVEGPTSDSLHILEDLLLEIDLRANPPIVYLDIETSREKDVSYGNVHMNNLLCVGVGLEDDDTVYVFDDGCFKDEEFRRLFRRLLDLEQSGAQNGKYDLGSLRAFLGGYSTYEAPILKEDTMLKSYMQFEYGGVHGLEYMGMEVLGTPDWKHDIVPYLRGPDGKGEVDYGNIPRHILYKYNAFDVHTTRLLDAIYSAEIERLDLTRGYRFLIRASNALTLIEPRGLGFDVPYSAELSARLEGEKEGYQRQLPIVSSPNAKSKHLREPHILNPDSPDQVTQYLADHGVNVDTTESDVLQELLGMYSVPLEVKATVETILNVRKITKKDGTFVRGIRNRVTPDGTVNPSFLLHGTTSGRLSARNPNSQNIMRDKEIKRQFISRSPDTHTMVGVDMSQAELRVLAWLAQDHDLRDIFNDPSRDLFVELTRMMFPTLTEGLSFKEVKDHPVRPKIKGAVYGLAYGRTAGGLAADADLHMTFKEATEILANLSRAIPGVITYLDGVAKQAIDVNVPALTTPFGRQRRFHLITDMNLRDVMNEARSFPAQSIASDIVLEAACRLTFDHNVFIVNLVHDAIYADVPKEDADRIADLISRVMIEVAEEVTEGYVKFATDKKVGPSWADV